jgi:hypothetical protein
MLDMLTILSPEHFPAKIFRRPFQREMDKADVVAAHVLQADLNVGERSSIETHTKPLHIPAHFKRPPESSNTFVTRPRPSVTFLSPAEETR